MSLIVESEPSSGASGWIPLAQQVPILGTGAEAVGSALDDDMAAFTGGAIGTLGEVVGFLADPFGALMSSVAAVMIEYMDPVQKLLDAVVGNPASAAAESATWSNIKTRLHKVADSYETDVANALEGWEGPAASAYEWASDQVSALVRAMGNTCGEIATSFAVASAVVEAVRNVVTSILTDLVGTLISLFIQSVATAGLGTAWAVPQGCLQIAESTGEATTVTQKLIRAFNKLARACAKLENCFASAGDDTNAMAEILFEAPKGLKEIGKTSLENLIGGTPNVSTSMGYINDLGPIFTQLEHPGKVKEQ